LFFVWLGSITLSCQGRGPWQGIGSGQSSQGRGSGKAEARETLAFRKVFWRFRMRNACVSQGFLAIWHAFLLKIIENQRKSENQKTDEAKAKN
jgi:hypothetical protein